jgi:AraC-like DNA-binding protein
LAHHIYTGECRSRFLSSTTTPYVASSRSEFENLLIATGSKLEREWPANLVAHDGLAPTLRALIMVSANTYRTIVYICADTPESIERKLEYGLSATPLARTLLDALFAVVYLFDDPRARPEDFFRGGWREMFEENARYHAAYGHDPSWAAFAVEHDRQLREVETLVGISAAERANPSSVAYWPTPALMKKRIAAADRKRFLDYMNDWFMREMSQDTHMSWPGLLRRFRPMTAPAAGGVREELLKKWKSDAVGTSIALMLSLMSEIEIELRYGLADRLKYVWGVMNQYYLISKEIYDFRYEGRL